jgi:hypothetical protein
MRELDDDRRLVGIHGVTLRPTRHRFMHDGRNQHTLCAYDSIGIPAALRLDATAHTNCPSCGASLAVDIGDRGAPCGRPHHHSAMAELPISMCRCSASTL